MFGRLHLSNVVVLCAALTAVLGSAVGSSAQTGGGTAQERAAVALVRQWFAAWQTGDADRVASLAGNDIVFQGLPTQPIERGRDTLRQHVSKLGGAKKIEVVEALGVGGSTGVVVLTKRLLTVTIDGKDVTTPMAATVRVVDGKIVYWMDFPLEPIGPPRR